jgi:hypothetical protein
MTTKDDIPTTPLSINDSIDDGSLIDKNEKKKKNSAKAFAKFLYDPRKKTVLGRDSLTWGK